MLSVLCRGFISAALAFCASFAFAQQARIITTTGPLLVNIDPSRSQPLCGGANQAACDHKPARFEGLPNQYCPFFHEDANGRILSVSESQTPGSRQSFFDIGKWQCWTCPRGYDRSTSPVDGDRACQRVVQHTVKSTFAPARFQGRLCPAGSFFDPIRGGECYSCPPGYRRSAAHIDAPNACFVPAREGFARAERFGNKRISNPFQCPGGFFHDGWDGGGCWRCPNGTRRTAYHINDGQGRACVGIVPEQHAKATLVKQAKCQPGEFYDMMIAGGQDPAAGGGCWTCPPTMVRGIGPVNSDRACSVEAGLEFKRATFVADLTCPAGQIYDMVKLTSEEARSRPETLEKLRRGERVGVDQNGTCWSCPDGYSRHFLFSVKAPNACQAGMYWYSAPYKAPGLFGLPGAEEVLWEVTSRTRERAYQGGNPIRLAIEKVADAEARATKAQRAALLATEAQRFISQPQNSTAAAAVVFGRLLVAIAEPAKATPAERKLVDSFRNFVVGYRTHLAQDAISYYQAWKAADAYWKSKTPNLANNFLRDVLIPAPDFQASAFAAAMLNTVAIEAAGYIPVYGDYISTALSLFSSATDGGLANPATTAGMLGRTAAEIALAKSVEALATMLLAAPPPKVAAMGGAMLNGLNMFKAQAAVAAPAKATLALGPQLVIGTSLVVAALTLDRIIEINNALPGLHAALKTAQSDPQLTRMVQTAPGLAEVTTYWSYATAGTTAPSLIWLRSFSPMAVAAVGMQ